MKNMFGHFRSRTQTSDSTSENPVPGPNFCVVSEFRVEKPECLQQGAKNSRTKLRNHIFQLVFYFLCSFFVILNMFMRYVNLSKIYRAVLKTRRHARVSGVLGVYLGDIWRTFGGHLEEICQKFEGNQEEIRREKPNF